MAAFNPRPQNAPGASAAVGHTLENGIPLSIFPIAVDKLCICFCGLPGRGKTHIARRLAKYLTFFHAVPVEVYNVAEHRRRTHDLDVRKDIAFFDPDDPKAQEALEDSYQQSLAEMALFLQNTSNGVAIFDHANATHAIRNKVVHDMHATGTKVMFIEVQNNDPEFLKRQSSAYDGMTDADAKIYFKKKMEVFGNTYEPLNGPVSKAVDSKWSYLVCDHSKQHFVVHNVKGYLQQKIVNFIMNMRTTTHSFYLSRHGQSEYNDLGRIGGDSGLTAHGLAYAQNLAKFVDERIVKDPVSGADVPARLWTSTMRRTKETAQFIPQTKLLIKSEEDPQLEYEWLQMRRRSWHHLDELFAGACDGMTYEEIEEQFPEEWHRRSVDKLAYRYPRGESYLDVIARLEPIIIEMERHQEPLLIIAHQGILRIIYAFYKDFSRAEAPYLSIPLNTVVELTPEAFICKEQRHVLYHPTKAIKIDGQDERDSTLTARKSDDSALAVAVDKVAEVLAAVLDPPSH